MHSKLSEKGFKSARMLWQEQKTQINDHLYMTGQMFSVESSKMRNRSSSYATYRTPTLFSRSSLFRVCTFSFVVVRVVCFLVGTCSGVLLRSLLLLTSDRTISELAWLQNPFVRHLTRTTTKLYILLDCNNFSIRVTRTERFSEQLVPILCEVYTAFGGVRGKVTFEQPLPHTTQISNCG